MERLYSVIFKPLRLGRIGRERWLFQAKLPREKV